MTLVILVFSEREFLYYGVIDFIFETFNFICETGKQNCV